MPLDLRGTEFRKRCWKELLRIPYGETRTYAEIARAVGSPAGFRAVGQANHYNPVAIIVPCHRVLASGNAWAATAVDCRSKRCCSSWKAQSFAKTQLSRTSQPSRCNLRMRCYEATRLTPGQGATP